MAVNRAQIAFFVGPFVPDGDAVVLEVADVGVAGDEPEEFVNDGFQVHFLGGQKGESLFQVEAHLIAEHALRAGSGPVAFQDAVCADMAEKVKVLLHTTKVVNLFCIFAFQNELNL